MINKLPKHLQKYVVEQDTTSYTPIDHAVWRFSLRQLKTHLSEKAHSSYLNGLEATGIKIEEIPDVNFISQKLEKFGWHAVPVSGFIPPAAFLEMQALNFLPIARDIRNVDHIPYTPAPDIIHEAAGHAPFIVDPDFCKYLENYAHVAKYAILSKEDIEVYDAIRELSDLKEHPNSSAEEIKAAEDKLNQAVNSVSHVSEAAKMSRMYWWSAEYGLVGDLNDPKIYGAGLLSSIGESNSCLLDNVKKIPFTMDCTEQGFDITERQPQLFVAPDFSVLTEELQKLSDTMAYKRGGTYGLDVAIKAASENTVELNSGIQISGKLVEYKKFQEEASYLHFSGPCQLSFDELQLDGHGIDYHSQGFGSPLGKLKNHLKCLSNFDQKDLDALGLIKNQKVLLEYESGVTVNGILSDLKFKNNKLILLVFNDCRVSLNNTILFDPSWGTYDMAIGSSIISVFGGPADREAYGDTVDFVAHMVPAKIDASTQELFEIYQEIRDLRNVYLNTNTVAENLENRIEEILLHIEKDHSSAWLAKVELLELSYLLQTKPSYQQKLIDDINKVGEEKDHLKIHIIKALELAPNLRV